MQNIKRYPLIWLSWDFVQDCYHGQSLITGLIPNQNFINKIFALTGVSLLTTAFPKVIYDKNRLRSWDGSVGTAVAVAGGVDGVAQVMAPGQNGADELAGRQSKENCFLVLPHLFWNFDFDNIHL